MKNTICLKFPFLFDKNSSATLTLQNIDSKNIAEQGEFWKSVAEKINLELIEFVKEKINRLSFIGDVDFHSIAKPDVFDHTLNHDKHVSRQMWKAEKLIEIIDDPEDTLKYKKYNYFFRLFVQDCHKKDQEVLVRMADFLKCLEEKRLDEIKILKISLEELEKAIKFSEAGYCCVYNGRYNEIFGKEK
jgi:hypothetical protein